MNQQLSPADTRRVAIFERFVRNANHLLKKKSVKEINKIINDQDGFLRWIKDIETRERLLTASKELRDTALGSLQNFDGVMIKLKNCKQILKWKNPQEITTFFEGVDRDIAKIPDPQMRQSLQENSSYWKTRWLDEYYISSIKNTLDRVSADRSLAWKTVEEVENFFAPVQIDLSKVTNEEMAWVLACSLEYEKGYILQMIDFQKQQDSFPDWLNEKKPD